MGDWHLYMVRCGDGSLYTGIAIDVARRLAEHRAGKGAKYLRGRGPIQPVFEKRIGSRSQALKAERQVKKLSKQAKEALVRSNAKSDPAIFSPGHD